MWDFRLWVRIPPPLPKILGEAVEIYVGTDKGRWPKGTRVKKVQSEPGDAHRDGALGTIVGALGPASPSQRAELIIELAKKGVNGDAEYFYWVEWDDMLGIPVGIADYRIEPITEEEGV